MSFRCRQIVGSGQLAPIWIEHHGKHGQFQNPFQHFGIHEEVRSVLLNDLIPIP